MARCFVCVLVAAELSLTGRMGLNIVGIWGNRGGIR